MTRIKLVVIPSALLINCGLQTVLAIETCSGYSPDGNYWSLVCSQYCCLSGTLKQCCSSCARSITKTCGIYDDDAIYLVRIIGPILTFLLVAFFLVIVLKCFCRKTQHGWIITRRAAQISTQQQQQHQAITTITVATHHNQPHQHHGYGAQMMPTAPPPYCPVPLGQPSYAHPMVAGYGAPMEAPYPPPPSYSYK